MTPVSGTPVYSTYHIEFACDDVTFNSVDTRDGQYWVIVEYPNADYLYPDDTSVPAPDAMLAAFFRFTDLYIHNEPYNADPICDIVPDDTYPVDAYDEFDACFDATGSNDPDGSIVTWEWDFDGDGIFDETPDDDHTGTDDYPCHLYTEDYVGEVSLRITDDFGAVVTCSVDVDITITSTVLFWYDGTQDDGGCTTSCGSGWAYSSSIQAWDESGGGSYPPNRCGAFRTPNFDIPAGVSSVHVEIKHWRNTETNFDGGIQGVSNNSGATWNWHRPGVNVFTYSSGTNFYSLMYHFGIYYQNCCNVGSYPYSDWTNRCWQGTGGSQSSPQTSDFTFNAYIGQDDICLGFGFMSDGSVQYGGWSIREIKVYFVP